MSRTERGEKGGGYDYWSRRDSANGHNTPGKVAKKQTRKRERQQDKRLIEYVDEPRDSVNDEAYNDYVRDCQDGMFDPSSEDDL